MLTQASPSCNAYPTLRVMMLGVVLVSSLLDGCALQPQKPSMWMLENDCQINSPIDQIASCTRASLDTQYGSAWRSAPAATGFLNFIDTTVSRVQQGTISDQEARAEITSFATRQTALVQEQKAQQDAANLQMGLALLAAAGSQYQPAAPGKLMLFGGQDHKTYLGCLNCGQYAFDSVSNSYGNFGSTYSLSSIFNSYSEFGSAYSMYSACNPYASDPPVIVDQAGDFYGRLTMNTFNSQRTRDDGTNRWLEALCEH